VKKTSQHGGTGQVNEMGMKIVEDTKNEVLDRREIIADVEAEQLPSRNEVRAKLAALAGVNEKSLIIEKIDSSFGNPKITIKANAYNDEETMNKIEKEYFIKRNFPKEEVKKETEEVAAPKEEAKEAPTEEKKEEIKVEEAPKEKVEEPAKEETPVEEKKEEATPTKAPKEGVKVEEVKEEAKTEESKEETPAEKKKEEAEPAKEKAEDAPKEEAPAEKKEEKKE